jgi:hypothetical protein
MKETTRLALEAAETAKLNAVRDKLKRALTDPSPSIPIEDVVARIEAALELSSAHPQTGVIPDTRDA